MADNQNQCQKPNCHRNHEETYRGPNDNTLRLCGKHYYKLVSRGRSETEPLGLGLDTIPESHWIGCATEMTRSTAPEMNIDTTPTDPIRPGGEEEG